MSNPNPGLIKMYLRNLLKALEEKEQEEKVTHCKRKDGTNRAYFHTKEEADAFAKDPTHPAYHGDITTFCTACGFFHLSRPDWLEHLPMETAATKRTIN